VRACWFCRYDEVKASPERAVKVLEVRGEKREVKVLELRGEKREVKVKVESC
jgi:hypothetical protein